MRKSYLNWIPLLVAVVLLVLAAPPCDAGPSDKSWERATVKRDWRQQYSPMTANMNMWLTRRVRQPNGTYREERFTAWLRIDVRVSFAPLRAGEQEEFEIQARDTGFMGDDPAVQLEVRPVDTYYSYMWTTRTIVVRNQGMQWETLSLNAGMRQRLPAPATVDAMSVQLTTPTSPVVFKWHDYGAADNPGSTAEYRFRVGRTRGLASDIVVAEGVVGTAQTVTLTADSPYCQGHAEYFKTGEKYRLVIWMKRKGSDVYTEEWGPAEWGTFVFQQGAQIMQAPLPEKILLPEQEKFQTLYGGQ